MGKLRRSLGGMLVALCLLPSSVDAAPPVCTGGIVALTFDDGAVPETEAVLDALTVVAVAVTIRERSRMHMTALRWLESSAG